MQTQGQMQTFFEIPKRQNEYLALLQIEFNYIYLVETFVRLPYILEMTKCCIVAGDTEAKKQRLGLRCGHSVM